MGLYWGYMGIMEKKMETAMVYWGYIEFRVWGYIIPFPETIEIEGLGC